jgi:hypothetical protein
LMTCVLLLAGVAVYRRGRRSIEQAGLAHSTKPT